MGDVDTWTKTQNKPEVNRFISLSDRRCITCNKRFNKTVRVTKKYCNRIENKYCHAKRNTMLKRMGREKRMEREKENIQLMETETFYDQIKALEVRVKKLEMLAGIRDAIVQN